MKILNYLNLSNKKSHLDVHVIEKDLLNDPVNVKQKKMKSCSGRNTSLFQCLLLLHIVSYSNLCDKLTKRESYINTPQILTVVLKKAFPDMMRFLVTTMMLYLGFMFCGWAVLGPYHIKVSSVLSLVHVLL